MLLPVSLAGLQYTMLSYNYSVENQTLTEALDKQQNGVHHIYSSIAELLVDHPMKSHTPPETEEQGLWSSASMP